MAQGTQKLSKPKASTTNSKKSKALGPRPGQRVIAPKKQTLIKQKALKKKVSSGLTAMTEKNLAEKAGHLELLAGGKKDKKKAAAGKQPTGK